jgi:hypothetical protein
MFTYLEKGDYHNLPSWVLMELGGGLWMLRPLLPLLGVGLLLILLGERGGGQYQVLSPLRLIIEEDLYLVHHHCRLALNMLEDLLDRQRLLRQVRLQVQMLRTFTSSTLPEKLLFHHLLDQRVRNLLRSLVISNRIN